MKNRLKELRTKRGLTLRELDELTGVSYVIISKLENSITSFSAEYTAKFCKFFGVSADYLLGIDDRIAFYKDDDSKLTQEQIDAINGLIEFYKNQNKK